MPEQSSPASLRRWCADTLGSAPVKELFVRRQTATVVGYRLADGRRVVVKARHDPVGRVRACLAVQQALFAGSYPCPRPITAPAIVDGLTVHAEELCDPGDRLLGNDVEVAEPFAAAYADLMNRLERLTVVADPEILTPPPWVGWWRQRPWSTSPAVPDAVSDAAARVRSRLLEVQQAPVIGHADWETQNLRWSRGQLVVAYDWDSVSWLPEPVLVGAAASTFPSDTQPVVASPEATAAFLEHYQQRRGRWFSKDELEVAWAAGLLPVLHNARQEALAHLRPLILAQLPRQVQERLRLAGA